MNKQAAKYILFSVVTSLLLGSCLGTRHLKESEKLLYRQSIKAPRFIDDDALENLYAQQPNRKFLGMPIAPLVGIYYLGERHYDTSKLHIKRKYVIEKFTKKAANTRKPKRLTNLQFRKQKKLDKISDKLQNGNTIMQWGEPVSVFDSTLVTSTKDKLKAYLFSEGYFINTVTSKTTAVGKFVNQSYRAELGQPYIIDSIFYEIRDSTILGLIEQSQNKSHLQKRERYVADNFSKERERIDLLLKDFGYYDFSRQYIEFEVDTTSLGNRRVCIGLLIRDPADRDLHKQFLVDSVIMNIAPTGSLLTKNRSAQAYRNVTFSYTQLDYRLKTVRQRIFLTPSKLYSRTNTLTTQRQLANLDAFKFVNINYDTSGGQFIANIFTSPLDRYEWSNEIGVSVTQGFPGPFYSLNFKKRNIFRGLENFDLNGRIGFEGVASATDKLNIYQSTEASANASLTFPRFILPLSESARLKVNRYNPKTRVSVGYGYTDRPEYRRSSTNISGAYTWQKALSHYYSLSLVNLSIINSKNIQSEFQEFLDEQRDLGNFSLANSFQPSFVSSMLLSFTWNPDNYGNTLKSSHYIRTSLESGGTIFNFFKPTLIEKQRLAYYKYLRVNIDARRITVLNKNTLIATRFNGGFAYSYNNDKSLPYEKFFFAGGSNSIRAWRPRRLGPGSFKPPLSANPDADGLYSYQIEQPGEVLLEGSVELRKKLFGFVSGALFVDAGNVWTRSERKSDLTDTNQGNSKFELDRFYKEIAVGTGFGFRFDFSFLILRFDVGMKVIDPARDSKDKFVLDDVRFFKPFGASKEPVIYNIGIGYPF